MKTLYSSAFASMVLGFLMVMGYNNQPVEIVHTEKPPEFVTIFEPKEPMVTDKVQVDIFDGLQCVHCDTFFGDTLSKIRDLEKESGEISLKLYFIPDINDDTMSQAAMALKCSGDQGQFWEMHAKIHGAASLDPKGFAKMAQDLKLDPKKFKDCMDTKQFQTEIESDIQYASEKGITVKPSILVNDTKLVGAQPFENIQRIIRKALADEEQQKSDMQFSESPTDLQQELKGAFQMTNP
jgi:protein-disulfide isomerase